MKGFYEDKDGRFGAFSGCGDGQKSVFKRLAREFHVERRSSKPDMVPKIEVKPHKGIGLELTIDYL